VKARNIATAARSITALKGISSDQKKFGLLRRANCYVFEEISLSAFEALGYSVIRGDRYSGDGGIDGKVVIKGKTVLIQAKKYKSYISAKHVLEFSNICRKHKAKGIFIHTGKTGSKSWKSTGHNVDIVSGKRMLKLLCGKAYKPQWKKKHWAIRMIWGLVILPFKLIFFTRK